MDLLAVKLGIMASALPTFPPFNIHETALDVHWRKWIKRLDNLLVGMDVKDKKRQRALLLHYAGEDVNDIFETLSDTGDDYATAVKKLTDYFEPRKNTEYEVYKFRQAKQQTDEGIDAYLTRLRQLSINCEFGDVNKEIKSQIIQGCSSTRLRRRALREDQTLDDLLKLARSMELSDKQACEIEHTDKPESTNAVRAFKKKHRTVDKRKHFPKSPESKTPTKKQTCRNCGGEYPHVDRQCPAKGKTCHACKKQNHFSSVCRSKRKGNRRSVNQVEKTNACDTSSDSEDYVFGMQEEENVNAVKSKQPSLNVTVNGLNVRMLVDTGSSINVLDENTYQKFQVKPKLLKTDTKVFTYGSNTNFPLLGKFIGTLETQHKITTATIYVTKGASGCLLCYDSAVELQVIPEIAMFSSDNNKAEQLCQKYSSVFEGIGKLKDVEIDLHVDPNVQPVQQPHRRIPFHVRKDVEKELKIMMENDLIEEVDGGATPWVSPIVVAPKPKSPNEVRICVDMREPNRAIKRTRYIIPTVDDIIVDLNGAKVFSKLDLVKGYNQLVLSESSRNITCFTTHAGLFRYKRLCFGINSAAEIFQNTLRNVLHGLEGVKNISDDIIVYGKDQAEHDKRLEAALARLQEKNLTLNKKKCEFNKDKIEFYGHIFSSAGISASPQKVDAIKNMDIPSCVSEVRSLLAMSNYLSRFIPNYSTITAPLRYLTRHDVQWHWETEQDSAFNELKRVLTSDTVMAYFDPKEQTETVLSVDASPVGLGSVLMQNGKVIAYASRSLSDVEKRYSQTEREALSIVWAIEHFRLYLYGHYFTLISDHQALEIIFNNPKSKPPARILRWQLRLQDYNFKVIYKSGKSNISDYLSRHPNKDQLISDKSRQQEIAECYVNYLIDSSVPKSMTLKEICLSTNNDHELQTVMQCVKSGSWDKSYQNKTVDTFSRLKNELTVVKVQHGEILLHENRLVIPNELQTRVIELAHQSHLGIVKTKQLLREKVYFPGIDRKVEELCQSCIPCLAATPMKTSEPLQMSDLPDAPWTVLSMDFCGPFPNGSYLLVLMDEYSRYPVVEIINSLCAKTVIPVLDKIFSLLGCPVVLKSDNGAPMNSEAFRNFANYIGFEHRKITPLWPKANSECERFNKTICKAIRAACVENRNWKQEMYNFLRNYRATKHATLNKAPAEILFGRNIKTRLPQFVPKSNDKKLRGTDKQKKLKMKVYADERNNARKSNLTVGDNVLVKQPKENKLSTPFDPKPYQITNRKGTMVTASREDKSITRNSTFFKPIHGHVQVPPTNDDSDDFTGPAEGETLRRSNRERRPPTYLEDYVTT